MSSQLKIRILYRDEVWPIDVRGSDTLGTLKNRIYEKWNNVEPDQQKLYLNVSAEDRRQMAKPGCASAVIAEKELRGNSTTLKELLQGAASSANNEILVRKRF
ncbi:unnamed protein product [Amoebophrya sp. A25]|nr:unnamed protein product [Amoebophrya sp. A25]|eukprot:GSA25T00017421001.1